MFLVVGYYLVVEGRERRQPEEQETQKIKTTITKRRIKKNKEEE